MSLENTDTNNTYEKEMIPDGEYTFKVIMVTRVEKVPGLYEWQLSANDGNDYSVNLFGNEMGPLLRTLGCNETSKGRFTWDTIEVEGKFFHAKAYQIPDKKDPTLIRQKLKDFENAPPRNADVKAAAKKNDTPF